MITSGVERREDVKNRIKLAAITVNDAESALILEIKRARRIGVTWDEIAKSLEIKHRQAAHRKYAKLINEEDLNAS